MIPPGEPSPHAPPSPSTGRAFPRRSPIAPLFVWLLIQMAVLVVAAQRVPLSARFGQTSERLAVHAMLVVQIAAGALLFPWLLRDGTTALLVMASAVPFVQLAAYLAGVPYSRAMLAAAYVAGWLLALALWRPLLARTRAAMLGVAIAVSLALGGPLLAYLRIEYSPEPTVWTTLSHFGPIMGAFAQLDLTSPPLKSWMFLICFLATSLIAQPFSQPARRSIA